MAGPLSSFARTMEAENKKKEKGKNSSILD